MSVEEDAARSATAANLEAAGSTSPDEFAVIMGQTHYLLKDDAITTLLNSDDRLKRLIPSLSHLLRTGRINNEKALVLMKLRWKRAVRYELFMNSDKPASMAEFDAWVNFGFAAIEDMRAGWRGNLVTVRQRVFKLEGGTKEGGLLSKILGGFGR